MEKVSIAIDGPSGAGKSTIAKIISKKLGIIYLDTGAMYRTVALKAIKSGVDTKDMDALDKLIHDVNIMVKYVNDKQHILLDDVDVTEDIRTPEVSMGASNVAIIPSVRIKMVKLQQEIAKHNSVVMDGRDIGTYVLPNASIKLFLVASVEERALRRYNELKEKGSSVSLEEVMSDIIERDRQDSTRAFAPLKKADDAVEIDSTKLSIEQTVEKILSIIQA